VVEAGTFSTHSPGLVQGPVETYTINGATLTIPNPEAFGFDCGELEDGHAFKVVATKYLRDRRTYNIHQIVIQQVESGRFFATEYSTQEDEGFEWSPGMGRNCATTWREVFPHQVTTTVYR